MNAERICYRGASHGGNIKETRCAAAVSDNRAAGLACAKFHS
jgi:hypothetical protein